MGGGRSPVPRARLIAAVALLSLTAALLRADGGLPVARAQTPGPPNIVLVLTDDQRFDTLQVMPNVQALAEEGMTLRRAIVTNALCCPSRATILTGRYSHTTGVYSNVGPAGGWQAFQPSESDTIATALDAAGYRTGLIGKYLNGYFGDDLYVPPGWDRWSAFAEKNGRYYDYRMFDDAHGIVEHGSAPRDYSTDVIRRLSSAFVNNTPEDTPLFLMVATYAPHGAFIAAPRHDGAFRNAQVHLGPAVNEPNVADKPTYIQDRPILSSGVPRMRTRNQWETLLAVDQLVGRIVQVLRDTGRLSNTLFIFTSDNGLLNQEHRWAGKEVPYEESIRVPMVISFPGTIPERSVSSALVSNVDLAPTIADFAGVPLAANGTSLRPVLTRTASSVRDSIVLEHEEGTTPVPTYCGVRTQSFVFVHYTTGEEELYDLGADPRQLRNVVGSMPAKADELRALTQSRCQPTPPGFSW
jgi:arylsulfatase A-like enzyme